MVQILHEKDFLSNVDYLKQLVKELNSKSFSDYDSNLIYELIYAETYCTTFLSQVKNPKLAETVADIQMELQIIMSNIDSSHIKNATSNSEYKKLLSMRYNNVEDASYEETKSYTVVDGDSPIKLYITKKAPKIIFAFIMQLIIISGILPTTIEYIMNLIYGDVTSSNVSSLAGVINQLSGIITFLMNLIVTLSVCMILSSCMIDTMYLALPFFRNIIGELGQTDMMVSIEAKSAIMNFEGHAIQYKKIKSFDRVERNRYWLNAMLEVCSLAKSTEVGYNEVLHNKLKILANELDTLEKGSIDYYKALVKIELLHEKYMEGLSDYND